MKWKQESFASKLTFSYLSVFGVSLLLSALILTILFLNDRLSVYHIWVLAAAVFLISIFFAKGTSRFFVKRITDLTRVARQYAKGDLREKIYIDARDELRLLGDSMNRMAVELRNYIQGLEGEKTKLAAILEHMSEGVIAINKNKQTLLVNSALERIFNTDFQNAIGKSMLEVLQDYRIDEMMEKALKNREIISDEMELGPTGETAIKVNAIGIQQEDSEVAGVLVMHDITDLRRLQRVRQEFVANVSHELKTPLTSIKGFVETLLDGAIDDEEQARGFLKIVQKDSERLSRLIDDLLELSRLDSERAELEFVKLNISDELSSSLLIFHEALKDKNVTIDRHESSNQVIYVKGDRDRLNQVFVNLLDNAIKYSDPGGKITASISSDSSHCTIKVRDEGVGIPPEALPRIFERFYRVDKARSRELGGTGLGLAIAKHIIESHGGQIRCNSKLGEWTEFTFTLPLI